MIVKPKGTHDLYGEEVKYWQYVSRVVDEVMERYNYGFIRTPIFESTDYSIEVLAIQLILLVKKLMIL